MQLVYTFLEVAVALLSEDGGGLRAAEIRALTDAARGKPRALLRDRLLEREEWGRVVQLFDEDEGWGLLEDMVNVARLGSDPYALCPALLESPFLSRVL
jgi:hypothetical protein